MKDRKEDRQQAVNSLTAAFENVDGGEISEKIIT